MGVLGIAETGMMASIQSYTITANNVANANTPGFKSGRVNFTESYVAQSGQNANGVRNQVGQGVTSSADQNAEQAGETDTQDSSDVNLTTEFASLLATGQSLKANAKSAKAADFMLTTLLSM